MPQLTQQQLEDEFRTCPEAQQHGLSIDRDFVVSLYWRYLGHAPDANLDYHTQRITDGQMTRQQLEDEFRTCPEAQQHGLSIDRDFVVSLYWRYPGHAPDANLDYHTQRITDGQMTRQQLEDEFRTCPEAQQHGLSIDRDFVVSLYWRYLGHAPDANLDYHTQRITDGQMTRQQLEDEFRTCPEAQQHGLSIDRDFVVSLYWRYLGHAPDANLDYYTQRITDGQMTRQQLEDEFRTCPEAQQHGLSIDRDFVVSLYWRYLGHAPDANLDYYTQRITDGQMTRQQLEDEFRTCPEAQQHGPSTDFDFVVSLYWRVPGPAHGRQSRLPHPTDHRRTLPRSGRYHAAQRCPLSRSIHPIGRWPLRLVLPG